MNRHLWVKVAFFLFVVVTIVSCSTFGYVRTNDKQSLFSNNALLADQNYYTRAVMEYYFVNDFLGRFGEIKVAPDPDNKLDDETLYNVKVIDEVIEDLEFKCAYKIPADLVDLDSGLQFRYYLFTGEARASMQAFGITDIDASNETTYIVIDYIQFKDVRCSHLPTIRYAVGLRSELKINRVSSDFQFQGAQSLKNLAAQVELDQAEVFFSLKTIGITGLDARLNIPQGVSFDVTTYKDFQNSIEFIKSEFESEKNVIDTIEKTSTVTGEQEITLLKTDSRVNISPVIIPVLDDYRPNLRASLRPMITEIKALSKEKKRIERQKDLDTATKNRMYELIENEIDYMLNEREVFDELNAILTIDPLLIARKTNSIRQQKVEDVEDQTFSQRFPHLNGLDDELWQQLEYLYFYSDGISIEGYDVFLTGLEELKIDNATLRSIIETLDNELSPSDALLFQIVEELRQNGDLNGITTQSADDVFKDEFPNLYNLNRERMEELVGVLMFGNVSETALANFIEKLEVLNISDGQLIQIIDVVNSQDVTDTLLNRISDVLEAGGNLDSLKN